MDLFQENFQGGLDLRWKRHVVGGGALESDVGTLRLVNAPTGAQRYTNAQIDDYQQLLRRAFRWRPPLRLEVRARFSQEAHELCGTAGFGFWNDPFGMTGKRTPTLPRAIWFFFSSPPSNMALALGVPGAGWKAATIDAWRVPFFLLAPTAPLAMPLMRIRRLYRALWPVGQHAIGVSEMLIDLAMTEWHTYSLEWGKSHATFAVDGRPIFSCTTPPRGPLGLVIWKDNQAMQVTPWQLPRSLLVACGQRQWLEIAAIKCEQASL